MFLQRRRNGSDARFTPVAECEGATGCRLRMTAGASVSRRRRWASVQREDHEGCRSRERSTGASEQRAACCYITWQVAGFNQRFPKDGRPARMLGEAPRREEIWKEGLHGWCRSVGTGSKGVHPPTLGST
jgi:hypothetical protein